MEDNNATYMDGFSGDFLYFEGFLAKIELIFILYPERFEDYTTKVVYIISRLYWKAMNWADILIENRNPFLWNYEEFILRFNSAFGNNS